MSSAPRRASDNWWATHQLVEYLGALVACVDEESAIRTGLEYAAETLEADVAVLVRSGEIVTWLGVVAAPPAALLIAAAASPRPSRITLPELGSGIIVAAPLGGPDDGELMLVRLGEEAFAAEEINLLRGMAKALRMSCESVRLLLAERRARESMENAHRDSLTGLANRTLFLERLESVADHNRREGSRFALLYLDVDGFKVINDSLGHAAGDALLVQIGERIRSCLRSGDFAGRLGGDEFAVLVDAGPRGDAAVALAKRLLQVFDAAFEVERHRVVIRASVGVAISENGDHTGSELLRNADVAMYRAKSEGKGRYVVFEEVMYAAAVDRLQLESDLRHGVERGELRIHFQPIFDVATRRVRAVEALARWLHPTRGMVPPLDFVPVAEETGLINDIERWVLQESLRTLRSLQLRSPMLRPLSVSVNLSGIRLRDGDVVAEVKEALELSGMPPESLTLEVTESVLLMHTEATVEALRSLKDMGVRLAIDDFGAGYSSLTYLTMCDFDVLKIDRAFIHAMLGAADKAPVARAILAMARVLDLEVVAEGVETVDQLRLLQDMGCLHAQGDYFSPPLTERELGEMMTRQWAAHREAMIVPLRVAGGDAS